MAIITGITMTTITATRTVTTSICARPTCTCWAVGLLRDSGRILLDAQMDAPVVAEVREVIEQGPWPARLADLHVWQVGRGKYAVSASVVTRDARLDADTVRNARAIHEELVHVTVEIHRST